MNWLNGVSNWLFNRALRLPSKQTRGLQRALDKAGLPVDVHGLNDLVALQAAVQAAAAVQKIAGKAGVPNG